MSSKKEKSSIADLKAEIARMEDAIKAKTKALREEERRLETRKKILLGFVLQKWLEDGKISKEELRAGLDKYLTRKDERELFDLNPPTEDKPSPQSSPETTNTKPSSPSLLAYQPTSPIFRSHPVNF